MNERNTYNIKYKIFGVNPPIREERIIAYNMYHAIDKAVCIAHQQHPDKKSTIISLEMMTLPLPSPIPQQRSASIQSNIEN